MRGSVIRALGIWALLVPGAVALQPAFGDWQGFVPGLAGITAGVAVGWAAARFRLSAALTVLMATVVYLLFGGAAALPRTTIAGVIPTVETLRRLVLLAVYSWRDLLTIATPAGDFTGPAVVPWLAGLLAGVVAATIALRRRTVFWPLLVPPLYLAVSIAFGVRTAPTALWLGGALGLGMVTWVWLHQLAAQRSDNADILVNRKADAAQVARQAVAAVIILAAAATGAVGATAATGTHADRQVLRDRIAPPLDLRNYPSPLMSYRLMELDLKDTTLFTVTGMPEGARLRLAVMDRYDGNVFNVSQQANQYLRTGRTVSQDVQANAGLSVEVAAEYSGVWVPQAGAPSWLEFTGEHAVKLSEGAYYNRTANQTLTTSALAPGDRYRLEAAISPEPTPEERAALGAETAGNAPLAKLDAAPEILTTRATEYAEGAGTDFERLVAIETRLVEDGYYSDGSDQKSRSGHTAERLATMFNSPALVGDDEQYATAMAIMAGQLGVPARVVMGFYPKEYPGQEWQVKGTEAHVWVEAYFAGAGWVAFNPTPDRDKTLQTEVPKPKPKPKPQVDPPPNPPEKLPDEPVLADRDAEDGEGDDRFTIDWGLVLMALGVLGGAGVIASPFLLVLGLKARRTTRRRNAAVVRDAVSGGWKDIVDRARDLGFPASQCETRREAAARMQEAYPEVPIMPTARLMDSALYGPNQLAPAASEETWRQVDQIKRGMLQQVEWYRRPLALLSLRSLRRADKPADGFATSLSKSCSRGTVMTEEVKDA